MALLRILSKRLLSGNRVAASSATIAKESAPISAAVTADPPNLARSSIHCDSISSPDLPPPGIFRRFLQHRAINHHCTASLLPSFLKLPAGDELRKKLKSLHVPVGDDHLRLDVLSPPFLLPIPEEEGMGRLDVNAADLKKLMKSAQLEKIRRWLKNISTSTITYSEFVRICGDACGNGEVGPEFAKALDDSGNGDV